MQHEYIENNKLKKRKKRRPWIAMNKLKMQMRTITRTHYTDSNRATKHKKTRIFLRKIRRQKEDIEIRVITIRHMTQDHLPGNTGRWRAEKPDPQTNKETTSLWCRRKPIGEDTGDLRERKLGHEREQF